MSGQQTRMREDTRKLLSLGTWMMMGAVMAVAEVAMSGGAGRHGPRAAAGWIGFLAEFCLAPMGAFLLLLGLSKHWADRKR